MKSRNRAYGFLTAVEGLYAYGASMVGNRARHLRHRSLGDFRGADQLRSANSAR